MERRVERMAEEKTFVTAGSPLDLTLDLAVVRSKEVIRVESLRVAPPAAPDHVLFDVESLMIRPGERIALLGANGVGKSTFIRMLIDVLRGGERQGIRSSPQVRLGYYDQELDEVTSDASLVDFIIERVDVSDDQVRRRLIAAGFPYRDHDKRLAAMSGGERARALFIVLSLNAPNFLILDEPTNHIDIEGKEQLEEQLLASGAALLITSHDRRFLETVAQRYVLIQRGRLVDVIDPAAFYASAVDSVSAEARMASISSTNSTNSAAHSAAHRGAKAGADDDALARIVELESLLASDLARKPKFQKPSLQTQWRHELNTLYARLE